MNSTALGSPQERRAKLAESRAFTKAVEQEGKASHQRNLLRKIEAEKQALKFELTMGERARVKKEAASLAAARELEEGLVTFERTLRKVGADAGSASLNASAGATRSVGLSTTKPRTAMEEVSAFMSSLHSKKAADEDARRERERRRRRILVTQQSVAQAARETRDEEALLATLVRASAAESRLSEEYALRRRAKEEMKIRRAAREQMYRERREQDFADNMAREAEIARRLRQEYEEQTALERQRWRELREAAQEAKYRQRYDFCSQLVSEILDIADKAVAHRAAGGRADMEPEMRAWRALFASGQSQFPAAAPHGRDIAEPAAAADVLDWADAEDYVRGDGEWAPAHPVSAVGPALLELRRVAHPPPPPPTPPQVPQVPLALAVIGGPYSGRSTLVSNLAFYRALAIINPKQMLEEAIAGAQRGESTASAQLGAQAHAAAAAGEPVSDTLLAALVLEAIHAVDSAAFPGGYVIDGFPATEQQAQALEKLLTGYVPPPPPAPVPKGKAKATVAPTPAELAAAAPVSGLTAVLRITLAAEEGARRMAGLRFDLQTGTRYHLELKPPPNDPAVLARLVPADAATVAHNSAAATAWDAAQAPLEQWFGKFAQPLLHTVDGAPAENDVTKAALAAVDVAAAEKKRRQDEKAAAEAAAADAAQQAAAAAEAARSAALSAAAAKLAQPVAPAAPEKPGKPGARAPSPAPPPVTETPEEVVAKEEAAKADAERKAAEAKAELAGHLLQRWNEIEERYIEAVRGVSNNVRDLRRKMLLYLSKTREDFSAILQQPDNRPELVAKFLLQFNSDDAMPPSLRSSADGKAELHLRTDELRDALWAATDARKDLAAAERQSVAEDSWSKQTAKQLTVLYAELVQSEVDRYQAAKQTVTAYTAWQQGQPLPDTPYQPLNVLAPAEAAAPVKGAKPAAKPAAAAPAGKGAAPGKGAPAPVAEEGPDVLALALTRARTLLSEGDAAAALTPAVAAEEEVLRSRLQRIEQRAQLATEALQQRSVELLEEMESQIAARFRSEVDAVRSLVAEVKRNIEEGSKITYELRLAAGSAVIDRSMYAVAPTPPPPPAPPREPYYSDRFNGTQLRSLLEVLRSAGTNNLVTVAELSVVLLRLAAQSAETRALPSSWTARTPAELSDLAAQFDVGGGFVDIRRFVLELAFDSQPVPPVDALVGARRALGDVCAVTAFQAHPWWFVRQPRADVYDESGRLRDVLCETFACGDDAVAVGDMLLYLCATADGSAGLERAFALYGGSVSVQDAFAILHHGKADGARSVLPYSAASDAAALSRLQAVYASAGRTDGVASLNQLAMVPDGGHALGSCSIYAQRLSRALSLFALVAKAGVDGKLSLAGRQLTRVPQCLQQVAGSLTELDLSHNQLTSLPPMLFTMTSLTRLDLRQNALSSVPAALSQLTQLRSLRLHGNPLSVATLPTSLTSLSNLQEQPLDFGRAEDVPRALAALALLPKCKD